MNKEQKEKNIPAPVPPDNNDQNIQSVNPWQIKSWQIIIVGISIQVLYLFLKMIFPPKIIEEVMYSFFILIEIIVAIVFGGIPALLLYFNSTRKTGAILSLVFGLIAVFVLFTLIKSNDNPLYSKTSDLSLFIFTVYLSSFLIVGVNYFWKKV